MKKRFKKSVAALIREATDNFAEERGITSTAVVAWLLENKKRQLKALADGLISQTLTELVARELRKMEPTIDGPAEEQIELPGFPKRLPRRIGVPTYNSDGIRENDCYVKIEEATIAEIRLWLEKQKTAIGAFQENLVPVSDLLTLLEDQQRPVDILPEAWALVVSATFIAARRRASARY